MLSLIVSLFTSLTVQAAPLPVERAAQTLLTHYFKEYTLDFNFGEQTGVAAIYTNGKIAHLQVNEKLAKSGRLNEDQWLAILCHEAGHIYGGAPFTWTNPNDGGEDSAEGQADYFSTAKCLRTIWTDESANAAYVKNIPTKSVGQIRARGCRDNQCIRIVWNGLLTLQEVHFKQTIALDQKSNVVAKSTHCSHDSLPAQCRLDTVIAGAVCDADPNMPFGRNSQREGACATGPGARPACWFAPVNLDSYY